MEKAPIAVTAMVALLMPVVVPREADALGLLLPAVQKVEEAASRTCVDSGNYGFAFEVLAPYRVDAIGLPVRALGGGGTVFLFDGTSNTLILREQFPAADPGPPTEQLSFNFSPVRPVVLAPGVYVIAASCDPGELLPLDVDAEFDPRIRWLEGRQGPGDGRFPREPAADFGRYGVMWANFATLVPEPGVWAFLIAGFGLVGGALRRRRRPAA